ncbi:hypothetical protein SAMN05216275_102295 [Streptosporangium canum]|uniref:Uncharacterized protein n=1 Tax=Streptosporangium canum TaxID=324952 RepID=A0A1I3H090_9ACTN|nr:DUF2776 domain-containing protein [Streptosporangium canum]SFI28987.1 hypothetical protein SAMN05216275_102295 [Streptosporangium canum]
MVETKSAAGMEAMRETGRAPAAVRGHAAAGVGLITACVPGGGLRRPERPVRAPSGRA